MSSCWSRPPLLMRRCLAIVVILAVLVGYSSLGMVLADFEIQDWQYVKSIQIPGDLAGAGLAAITPDVEVFSQSATGLVDLRIVENGNTEVPFHILEERGSRQRELLPARIRDLGFVPGVHTTFVAEVTQIGGLHNEIEVFTPSQNFQRAATVEGSADGANWTVLQEGARIFDFTLRDPTFTTRHTSIRYPESTARFLRVRILDQQEEPLNISGASVFSVIDKPDRETSYAAEIIGGSEDGRAGPSVLNVDLGVNGLPTSRLKVDTVQVNFYRRIMLEASRDGKAWETISESAELFSYDTPRFVGSQLSVAYPETTLRYLRLTIFNQDDPPLNVEGLGVYGISRKLLFPARPAGSYELYYGKSDARAPSYDLARFLPYLEIEGLPQGILGPQMLNPAFMVPQKPLSERLPWLIPVMVALAAVVVGLLLLGVLKQARKVLPPPS